MQFYEVSNNTSEYLAIFANSFDHAVEIFLVYWMMQERGELPDLTIKQRNLGWTSVDRDAINGVLALGISGIGKYDSDQGWRILPLDQIDEEA